MKKIPTIFQRDWHGDRSRVVDQPHPDCAWVFAGEGHATQKLDGTCCMVRDGALFRRRELKVGQPAPAGFVAEGTDSETGKTVGWMPVSDVPEDALHREAFAKLQAVSIFGPIPDGTYELVGPKVQGNPEQRPSHMLERHALAPLFSPPPPRTFDGLREWMAGQDIEGIVFHHPDGRMAKIKLRDFGLKRTPRSA